MGQLQDIQKVFGRQEQEQQCLMVLCFLKQSQYDELELQYYKFKQNLNLFPSIVMSPFKIFINNGEIFQNSKEFLDYIQCVNLEGDLKRIVIFMDGCLQQSFINDYQKIYLNETYNEIFEIVVFDDKITASQNDYPLLQKYWKNITIFTDKQQCFLNFLQDSKGQQPYFNKSLQLKSTKVDEQIIEKVGKLIEIELERSKINQCISVNELEIAFTSFVDFRNQLVQKLFIQIPKTKQINNIIQGKFNYQIMEQISRYTNLFFDQLFEWIQKFQQTFYFCQYYGFVSAAFFNGYFKNKSCQNCYLQQASFDSLKTLYQQQRRGFSIDHCVKYLSQNQPSFAQDNRPTISKVANNFNHIILIGKTGVGKTTLFNLLCDGKVNRLNDPTKKSTIKRCLNSSLTIQDTPPFELENRDSIENSENAKQTFSTILAQTQISQIFIVVKYDRIPVMKQSAFGCIKFLYPFRDKISIIIFNDDQNEVVDRQNDFEKIFETNKILICNLRFQPGTLSEEIQNHLYSIRAQPEYLNLVNTDFDIKKKKKEQKVFLKNLEKINNKMNEDDIQKLNQENKDISKKLEQLNKEQLELIKKLNSNQQKIQDIYSGMVQKQNNAISLIKLD
ncbi:unnamed protein product (macronuclear) [Paramecium tetraurelia]|uniref:G domain-containing protein n=1 Tax=Paramecium tetraurelia TaxID=5888 RepID=A0BWB4_PARTE|nr:uncharacterized protein GSPATT00032683001 [Paramecium tetraurelia]CAK62831.1 unnamed protein product [Paramecium tetraurelia]|eukprot:XP_001430229.1 hypothetical protein (macronuclear) [Paramecium tetraurelia strain d4-2]